MTQFPDPAYQNKDSQPGFSHGHNIAQKKRKKHLVIKKEIKLLTISIKMVWVKKVEENVIGK